MTPSNVTHCRLPSIAARVAASADVENQPDAITARHMLRCVPMLGAAIGMADSFRTPISRPLAPESRRSGTLACRVAVLGDETTYVTWNLGLGGSFFFAWRMRFDEGACAWSCRSHAARAGTETYGLQPGVGEIPSEEGWPYPHECRYYRDRLMRIKARLWCWGHRLR